MATVQTHRELAFLQRARRRAQKPEREASGSVVGLGAGVEFVVGAGVDVSSAGRSSSSKAVGSPWEATIKANGSKRNGGRMLRDH